MIYIPLMHIHEAGYCLSLCWETYLVLKIFLWPSGRSLLLCSSTMIYHQLIFEMYIILNAYSWGRQYHLSLKETYYVQPVSFSWSFTLFDCVFPVLLTAVEWDTEVNVYYSGGMLCNMRVNLKMCFITIQMFKVFNN